MRPRSYTRGRNTSALLGLLVAGTMQVPQLQLQLLLVHVSMTCKQFTCVCVRQIFLEMARYIHGSCSALHSGWKATRATSYKGRLDSSKCVADFFEKCTRQSFTNWPRTCFTSSRSWIADSTQDIGVVTNGSRASTSQDGDTNNFVTSVIVF